MKKQIILFIKVSIAIGLLIALYASGKFEFRELLAVRDHWAAFALAQACFITVFLGTIIRWYLVMRAMDVPARIGDSVRLGWVGLLFSQVLLGATGGDLVKGFYIAKEHPDRRAEAVLSVVIDRVLGLTALMILGGIALIVNANLISEIPELRTLALLLGILVACILGGGALMAWERFWRQRWIQLIYLRLPGRALIGQFANALWTIRGKRKVLVVSLTLSLAIQTLNVVFHIVLAYSLRGDAPSVGAYFFLIPVGQLAFALPITPGGLGVAEWAYETLFQAIDQAQGAEIAILVRLTWALWALPGLVFYLLGKKKLQEALRAAEEDALGHSWEGVNESEVTQSR